jgi:hypothetical protein
MAYEKLILESGWVKTRGTIAMDEIDEGGIPVVLDRTNAFDYSIAYGNSINPYFVRSVNPHLALLFEEISNEHQCNIFQGVWNDGKIWITLNVNFEDGGWVAMLLVPKSAYMILEKIKDSCVRGGMDYIEIFVPLKSGTEFYLALAAYRREIVPPENDDELQFLVSQIVLKLERAYDSMIANGGYEMPVMREIMTNLKEEESRVPLYI